MDSAFSMRLPVSVSAQKEVHLSHAVFGSSTIRENLIFSLKNRQIATWRSGSAMIVTQPEADPDRYTASLQSYASSEAGGVSVVW